MRSEILWKRIVENAKYIADRTRDDVEAWDDPEDLLAPAVELAHDVVEWDKLDVP